MSFGEEFLTHPDLFPRRQSGERWGEEVLRLALPGGPYLLRGLAAAQRGALLERFARFASEALETGSTAGVELTMFRAPASDFVTIDPRGFEVRFDWEEDEAGLRIAGENVMARSSRGDRTAALWTADPGGPGFAGRVENLIRLLAARRLPTEGALLVHSCALLVDGAVRLAIGPSGVGKSTLARRALAAGYEVLSDDLNALAPGPPAMVEAIPFTGDLDPAGVRPGRWPLAAVFRLAQGSAAEARRLSPGESVASLLASIPFLAGAPDRAMAVCDQFLPAILALPSFALSVPLSDAPWRIMDECVTSGAKRAATPATDGR
jgi:hypothetical protein